MTRKQKLLLLLITFGAFLLRLPYWEVIPASYDEVNQTSFALLIAQGRSLPLVANDAYTGPFYVYLLATILRLGVTNPILGRMVVMVTGTLLVPITFFWVRLLGNDDQDNSAVLAGWIAAGFVAVNPDLILVNSHIGGATFLLPFFTTLFALTSTLAIRRDHIGWLLASGLLAGLALQSNPIAGLAVAGGLLWVLWRAKPLAKLGRYWPLWPVLAGCAVLLMYSPVIAYNLDSDFQTVEELEDRSYLWETSPTVESTQDNLRRFSYQLGRQVSGVVQGDETFASLVGFPLVVILLMLAGLVYTTRSVSWLPMLILLPYALVLPVFSHHYGFVYVGRFTTLLIPVWISVIGWILAAGYKNISGQDQLNLRWVRLAGGVGLLILLIFPVQSLFAYYEATVEANKTGRPLLDISRYVVDQNRGEPVYISEIGSLGLDGVPYVPHAAFLLGDIHHEFLPAQQIIGRLYSRPGSAYLILNNQDRDELSQIFSLERVPIVANEGAEAREFGLYFLDGDQPVQKPDFVLEPADVPINLSGQVVFSEAVELLGCQRLGDVVQANQLLLIECYWSATAEIPLSEYIGFIHLIDRNTNGLIAQDDHILGKEKYPLNAWLPGEVIKESYGLFVPEGADLSDFQLSAGIYTWPELVRLTVPNSNDNVAVLLFE